MNHVDFNVDMMIMSFADESYSISLFAAMCWSMWYSDDQGDWGVIPHHQSRMVAGFSWRRLSLGWRKHLWKIQVWQIEAEPLPTLSVKNDHSQACMPTYDYVNKIRKSRLSTSKSLRGKLFW